MRSLSRGWLKDRLNCGERFARSCLRKKRCARGRRSAALAENRASDPDMRRAANGSRPRSRRSSPSTATSARRVPASDRKQLEMRGRIVGKRRDAHQALDVEGHAPRGSAPRSPPPPRAATPAFCGSLPVFTSTKSVGRPSLPRDLLGERARRACRGRAYGSRRRAPRPRAPCWSGAGRSDADARSGWRSRSGGHFASASCTRFSPNSRCPAARTGTIASAPKVFDTAISVIPPGSRPARRAAAAIRALNLRQPLCGIRHARLRTRALTWPQRNRQIARKC